MKEEDNEIVLRPIYQADGRALLNVSFYELQEISKALELINKRRMYARNQYRKTISQTEQRDIQPRSCYVKLHVLSNLPVPNKTVPTDSGGLARPLTLNIASSN